jgi:hypothetical protein
MCEAEFFSFHFPHCRHEIDANICSTCRQTFPSHIHLMSAKIKFFFFHVLARQTSERVFVSNMCIFKTFSSLYCNEIRSLNLHEDFP